MCYYVHDGKEDDESTAHRVEKDVFV